MAGWLVTRAIMGEFVVRRLGWVIVAAAGGAVAAPAGRVVAAVAAVAVGARAVPAAVPAGLRAEAGTIGTGPEAGAMEIMLPPTLPARVGTADDDDAVVAAPGVGLEAAAAAAAAGVAATPAVGCVFIVLAVLNAGMVVPAGPLPIVTELTSPDPGARPAGTFPGGDRGAGLVGRVSAGLANQCTSESQSKPWG